eukprot:359211-Chlamydomonas_euryale.AAC.10
MHPSEVKCSCMCMCMRMCLCKRRALPQKHACEHGELALPCTHIWHATPRAWQVAPTCTACAPPHAAACPPVTQRACVRMRCIRQVGCGAGNTVFPCLEMNPELHIYACDFSHKAVGIVQAHPSYQSGAWRVRPAAVRLASLQRCGSGALHRHTRTRMQHHVSCRDTAGCTTRSTCANGVAAATFLYGLEAFLACLPFCHWFILPASLLDRLPFCHSVCLLFFTVGSSPLLNLACLLFCLPPFCVTTVSLGIATYLKNATYLTNELATVSLGIATCLANIGAVNYSSAPLLICGIPTDVGVPGQRLCWRAPVRILTWRIAASACLSARWFDSRCPRHHHRLADLACAVSRRLACTVSR